LFPADAKTLDRIELVIRRVLIVDPNQASARLLLDIVKSLGARQVVTEADERRAMDHAREMEPGMIFTERTGPGLDGEQLARKLRRSNFGCRRAPIIMITADATASSIKGARDSGIHEFLRKPFTGGDLFKRVENVALKPRGWIEAVSYIGPDRRRFNSGDYTGPQKRSDDKPANAGAAATALKDQAMRVLSAALAQFDSDPMQATRAVMQQAETLKALATNTSDARLAVAAAGLEAILASGPPTRGELTGPIAEILALADPDTKLALAG
jgi:two-component system, response regulator PdtaR